MMKRCYGGFFKILYEFLGRVNFNDIIENGLFKLSKSKIKNLKPICPEDSLSKKLNYASLDFLTLTLWLLFRIRFCKIRTENLRDWSKFRPGFEKNWSEKRFHPPFPFLIVPWSKYWNLKNYQRPGLRLSWIPFGLWTLFLRFIRCPFWGQVRYNL